jgi:hypothetical protein
VQFACRRQCSRDYAGIREIQGDTLGPTSHGRLHRAVRCLSELAERLPLRPRRLEGVFRAVRRRPRTAAAACEKLPKITVAFRTLETGDTQRSPKDYRSVGTHLGEYLTDCLHVPRGGYP